jgi:hypothetical protein
VRSLLNRCGIAAATLRNRIAINSGITAQSLRNPFEIAAQLQRDRCAITAQSLHNY